MTAPDDHQLLAQWQAGDAPAGEALVERHFQRIYNFFHTKLEAEADELVQATFFACVRTVHQFRAESSFRTYLFAIARHELYRVLRERQKANNVDFELSSIAELTTTPGTRLDRDHEKARMVAALRELPVAQQTLLELHYWEHVEIAELAEIFESNAVAIRQRLHRARIALRERMLTDSRVSPQALATLESMDVWARGLAQ